MNSATISLKEVSEALKKLITSWGHVAKRSLAHWRLLSSVMIGVLLASTIMAGTVLYFDALRQLALKQTLGKLSPPELDIVVETERGPTTREEYAKVFDPIEAEVDARVAWMLRDRVRGGRTPTFFLTLSGNEPTAGQDNARTYFTFLPKLAQHTTILPGGKFPAASQLSAPGDPPELEAIVPEEAARLLDVGVGDRLSAVPVWRGSVPWVSVVISGLFRRNEPVDEEFWSLEERSLRAVSGPNFRTLPFFVLQESFFDVVGQSLPKMESTYAWLLKTDSGRVNAWNAEAALANMGLMNRKLAGTLSTYTQTSALDNALREYDKRIFFSRLSMFVVLILIAIVVLYYITTLSSLVIESRRAEVALLRGRGADPAQILTVFALEGIMIAAIAVLASPLLAAASISALGFTPPFGDLTAGTRLTVSITGSAYALSAIGGILSFVALIIPAVQASRIEVATQRQNSARPSTLLASQRYYVDVLLLVVSVFLFLQLTEQGSVLATDKFGRATADQLLLALPGLVLLASAMVLLRLFPLATTLASRLLSWRLPVGPVMGLWQMARSPAHYARLSLLLILTAALGIFASSFEATLDRSFTERVLYATGGDITVFKARAIGTGASPGPVPTDGASPELALVKAYEDISGVEQISPVVRSVGRDLTKSAGGGFEMLAMDGKRFGEVAFFRDDFSDKPIKGLLESLEASEVPRGIELPSDASTIALKVRPDILHPTVRVAVRLRNAAGLHANYTLGMLSSAEWTVLEAPLNEVLRQDFLASPPLSLVSIQLAETGLDRSLLAGSVLLDEISVTTETGQTIVIEPFNDDSGWAAIRNTPDALSDELRESGELFDGESGSVLFSWGVGGPVAPRGIFHGQGAAALPVLASSSFVKSTGHSVGEEFDVQVGHSRMTVTLAGVFDLFPTMTDPNKNLLVADLTSLIRYANLPATEPELFPVDLWISTGASGPERERLLQSLSDVEGYQSAAVFDRAQRLVTSKVDPLVEAGWNALLLIAFLAVLTLSCVAFLIHAYISLRNRELQFALLRAVGFSVRQLISMVWLEQMLVVALGLVVGTWMGGRLGAAIMPFLGHDAEGGAVVPPFAISVNWGALILSYAAMLVVFGVITLGLVWFIRRISLQRVLRLGER